MKVYPYLNFPGTTEEAMRFYAKSLGGTLGEIHRYGTMPSADRLPDDMKDRVMHVTLELPGGFLIMASDQIAGMGTPHVPGTNMSVSIQPASREEADRVFSALSEGGDITMPLADQFWGDYYGSLTDRYDVQWMVNYHPSTA